MICMYKVNPEDGEATRPLGLQHIVGRLVRFVGELYLRQLFVCLDDLLLEGLLVSLEPTIELFIRGR